MPTGDISTTIFHPSSSYGAFTSELNDLDHVAIVTRVAEGQHAFLHLWTGGPTTTTPRDIDVALAGFGTNTGEVYITNDDEVYGTVGTGDGHNRIWKYHIATDTFTVLAAPTNVWSLVDVNNKGALLFSHSGDASVRRVWNGVGEVTLAPLPGGDPDSVHGYALNDEGIAAGAIQVIPFFRAAIWCPDGSTDCSNTGVTIPDKTSGYAIAISNARHIVGNVTIQKRPTDAPTEKGILLTPK